MPTSNTYRADGSIATKSIGAEKSDAQIANAEATSRLSSTAGSGLGAKAKSAAGAPKQEPGEDAAAYGARMRQWREGQAQRASFK